MNNYKFCELYQLHIVDYEVAWQLQKRLVQARKQQLQKDALLLLEHPPVYTLGQGATPEFLKFSPSADAPQVLRTERGGEVTYHCPGQLVGYPILDLHNFRMDLHWYLRQLEEVIIVALKDWGIDGNRIQGLTGVWVEGCKIAAIGIKVSRWVSMHGFAVNVRPEMAGFERIVPCGIEDRPVGSVAQFRPDVTVVQMRESIAKAFAQVFGVRLQLGQPESLWALLKKTEI